MKTLKTTALHHKKANVKNVRDDKFGGGGAKTNYPAPYLRLIALAGNSLSW
jgi:hypothetical protein